MSSRLLLLLSVVVLIVGCGPAGPKIAPVSGVVMMDGKPLANVGVAFQPIGTAENPNPGRGSSGVTDANGRYTLKIDGEIDGAVVARHRVCISSVQNTAFNPETGSEDGAPAQREMIPAQYNFESKLEFDVQPEGTSKADFQLDSYETLRSKGQLSG
jgi:hypothetical protein